MDVRHNHGSDVFVVRSSYHDDAPDLVAIGGVHSVQVILAGSTSAQVIANFYTDEWTIEIAAAGADYGLYLLTKHHNQEEVVFPFGGGLSGHHGKVNDMAFCGGQSEDSSRYVASVSDDKMFMVWDLNPALTIRSPNSSDMGSGTSTRAQPTAYVINFPHPLATVCSHPSTSKEFLVADSRGSIFLTDWRSDPDENEQSSWRNASIVELVEPRAMADAVSGRAANWSSSVAWRRDSVDIIGAAYGSRFALWDLSKLQGGKPTLSGTSFPEGCGRFRWCPTYPEYFAVSTNCPTKGAVINVHNTAYLPTEPTAFVVGNRPLYIRDFDFLAAKGIPRVAAAVGREVVIFYIGIES